MWESVLKPFQSVSGPEVPDSEDDEPTMWESVLKPFQSVFGGDDEADDDKEDEDDESADDNEADDEEEEDDKNEDEEKADDDEEEEKDDEEKEKPAPKIKFDEKKFAKDWHTEWKHGDFPSYKETYSKDTYPGRKAIVAAEDAQSDGKVGPAGLSGPDVGAYLKVEPDDGM